MNRKKVKQKDNNIALENLRNYQEVQRKQTMLVKTITEVGILLNTVNLEPIEDYVDFIYFEKLSLLFFKLENYLKNL